MYHALLLDLDDTLLGNQADTFIPAYFNALGRALAHLVPPDDLLQMVYQASRYMEANDGSGTTTQEAFATAFKPVNGLTWRELKPQFMRFYREDFPKLRSVTQPRPAARHLIAWANQQAIDVVIATNPFFPRIAVEERLAWAGIPVTEFDYALVTTYENMLATKAHPAYYHQVIEHLGLAPETCLMAGDDWELDIVQAERAGLATYWIADPAATHPTPHASPVGQGHLSDLWDGIQEGTILFT